MTEIKGLKLEAFDSKGDKIDHHSFSVFFENGLAYGVIKEDTTMSEFVELRIKSTVDEPDGGKKTLK